MGFRINYSQVIRQANLISDAADDLEREITKLNNLLTSIKGDWEGPASKEFQNHVMILIAEMRKTKYSMSSVSSTIKNVANRIQEEDERQAELARQLAAANAVKDKL